MTSSHGGNSGEDKWAKATKRWERILLVSATDEMYAVTVEEGNGVCQLYGKVKEDEDLVDIWMKITNGKERIEDRTVIIERMNQELREARKEEELNRRNKEKEEYQEMIKTLIELVEDMRRRNKRRSVKAVKCYTCGGYGHIKNNCRERKNSDYKTGSEMENNTNKRNYYMSKSEETKKIINKDSEKENEDKNILVMIDMYTRVEKIVLQNNKKTEELISDVERFTRKKGRPEAIMSDTAKEFTSEEIEKYLINKGI
ncbi:hypothetical protein NEIRO03_1588 [Nematocida sp. AWRm78]|nr:hypothetical protein NEIRO02_0703 [Nematocida sp. AWRm79]KAI5184131.1 hypothetical protein NEIRO03_1588 [Nematocida sp. AWRm78]